jgi:hypothetical protein
MDGVRTRLSGTVIGCADAWALAEFYASLLGWKVVDRSEADPGGWALVRSPAGARVADHQPQPERLLVMLDPAGHPFCLFPGS